MSKLLNFPSTPTPFVGRREELNTLAACLRRPDCRLLTVLGPGGMGKTRLAIQAALEAGAQYPDGVCFVPLAPVASPDLLTPACVKSLGLELYGNAAPLAQLLDYLREKTLLLVMDSAEHLLPGQEFWERLLAAAPGLKLMITSRARLNLQQEWVFAIDGLDVPGAESLAAPAADDIEACSAVQLFVTTARRAYAHFAPAPDDWLAIARICRTVDGMPLAIELAAAWARMLSCREIAAEVERGSGLLSTPLHDFPEKHRSLQGVFDSSWRRLPAPEQVVFMRLSVFRGGFRTEAAREVAGASLPGLATLVDNSLLRGSPAGRYEIHELLRQYAEARLLEAPGEQEAVSGAHCTCYLNYAAQRRLDLRGGRQNEALAEIESEIENIRLAWSWAAAHGRPADLLAALDSLCEFYELKSRFHEAGQWLEATARALGDENALKCKVLAWQGVFYRWQGLYGPARGLLEQALDIARRVDSQEVLAFVLMNLSVTLSQLGQYLEARQLGDQALALYGDLVDTWAVGNCYGVLGTLTLSHQGTSSEARVFFEKCIAILSGAGDQRRMLMARLPLAGLHQNLGQYAEAGQLLEASLTLASQIDYRPGMANALYRLGVLHLYGLKQFPEAKAYFERCLLLKKEIGDQSSISFILNHLGDVAGNLDDYAGARRFYNESLVLARQVGTPEAVAVTLWSLGELAYHEGEFEDSLTYYRQALPGMLHTEWRVLGVFCEIGLLLRKLGETDQLLAMLALVFHHPHTPWPAKEGVRTQFNQWKENEGAADGERHSLLDNRGQAARWIARHIPALAETLAMDPDYLTRLSSALEVEAAPAAGAPPAPALKEPLTERERDVLQLMAAELSNKEIAARLVIGAGTVKTHTLNIYRKLEVRGRWQAISKAKELGLL